MNLDRIIQQGIALDIDETLSITAPQIFNDMIKLFGKPNDLTIEELIQKYKHVGNVPEWNTGNPQKWIMQQYRNIEYSKQFKVIEGALEYVLEINEIVPICAYITARPYTLQQPSEEWIQENGFPNAPVITRNSLKEKHGSKWKAKKLEKYWPTVLGIVDDNEYLLNYFTNYQGTIFLYGADSVPKSNFEVIACPNWEKTYEAIKTKFGK